MDKTIKINIAGILFQIDENAYRILQNYLQVINNRFRNVHGGNETIEDIESRIAEIFQSQKGLAGVITKENVESMISIIGKPEDFGNPGEHEEEIPPSSTSHKKRLYRNPDDSIISGVCGGLGAYLNTDPVLFRILFILIAFSGVGILVYIALWIAVPSAYNESKKREMYGNAYHSARSHYINTKRTESPGTPVYNSGYYNSSGIGNAFNEVFRALGRVCFIAFRVLLIIVGVAFVVSGFLVILSLVLIFIFKLPGAFTSEGLDWSLTYFPDFLNFIVNPALTPWIIALGLFILLLPMIFLIYWGLRMIIWFKAKDGIYNLVGLVLWVMAIATLSILLFNNGISFAETGKTSARYILSDNPDTLYIISNHKVADLDYNKMLTFPDNEYSIFMNEDKRELYIRPDLNIYHSHDGDSRIDIKKRSAGYNQHDAMQRAEGLKYSYSINGDTLILDEYFTIQSSRKWSADNIGIYIHIPEGTIVKMDSASFNLYNPDYWYDEDSNESEGWNTFNKTWVMSEEGLRAAAH